jgi:hypothetical protein
MAVSINHLSPQSKIKKKKKCIHRTHVELRVKNKIKSEEYFKLIKVQFDPTRSRTISTLYSHFFNSNSFYLYQQKIKAWSKFSTNTRVHTSFTIFTAPKKLD